MKGSRWASLGWMVVVGLLVQGVVAAESPSGQGESDPVDQLLVRHSLHLALEKLGRGVGNVIGGWLEVPLNIQKRYHPSDMLTSSLAGAGVGIVKGVVRTGVGLFEAATFCIPYPEGYAPILPPLDYFKDRSKPRWL